MERIFCFCKRDLFFLRALRVSAVIAVVFVVGCVPIRQNMVSRGSASSSPTGSTKTEFQKPEDFKNLPADAWKNEMEGIASWYGIDFNGRLTANGEIYDMYKYTAAHKTLPLGTVVKVTSLDNGKTVEVRINDRGPYVKGRVIDLSRTAGRAIDIREVGTAKVKLEVIRWPEKKGR
jgi:rare lipoprotein A (peptidoglycan hydrolase)